MKTCELERAALDWAVCEALGLFKKTHTYPNGITTSYVLLGKSGVLYDMLHGQAHYSPSTDWSQGGPIIEREKIHTFFAAGTWLAEHDVNQGCFIGPTPLIAAMRCYVASRLGYEVEVPKELT